MKLTNEQLVLKILFKDFLTDYNSRNLSKLIGISHAGTFKILKKLEKNKILNSKKVGNISIYKINYENNISKKIIDTILTIEADNYKRWLEEFKSLENKVNFLILFGSTLINYEKAKDVDILIVSDKRYYPEIYKFIKERNNLLLKKIHMIFQTPDDFNIDLNKHNKVTIEIIKKGIALFGQNEYIIMLNKNVTSI